MSSYDFASWTVKTGILVSLLMLFATVSYGQTAEESTGIPEVIRAETDISIDGSINDSAWMNATVMPLQYERFPDANADPPVATRCLITYDSNNLYIAFKASDPSPESIRTHFMNRDSRERLMRDDHVGITIDPFNNEQWGMQFRVNPLGVQADAIYSNQRNSTNYSWDAIWESAGTITENGYEVEIRIPFSSINVPSDSLQNWRISAFRNYPRSVQYEIRSHPINLDQYSKMAQFNQIDGFEDLSSGLNLKLNPVLTAKRTDNAASEGIDGLEEGPVNLNPGGNLQWGIKPNLNLSATINPDFSQIEADALQLRENQRFELSIPEKRPFFLESAEIFDTPLAAVFTRSIIEPDGGLKMTGKMGSHSFGIFATQDQSTRILFPANQQSQNKILKDRSYSEIARYRKQLTSNATIGFLGEARQSANTSYQNYVGGIDGYFQFLESNTLRFQYLRSSTNYTDEMAQNFNQVGGNFGGSALQLNYDHSSENWVGQAEYTSISSGFRNDNGFFPRADFQTARAAAQRVFRGNSNAWYSTIQVGPSFELTTDQSGMLTDRSISLAATYRGPLQSEIFTEYANAKQRFSNRLFAGLNTGVFFFRIQPSGFLSKFRMYTAYGNAVDFSNVRKANELIIHPGLTLDISRSLNLEIDPNYQRLSYDGTTTFSTYLLGMRMIYHLNRKTFFRSILQYRYVDRNAGEYDNTDTVDSLTQEFFYQLLFSYKINPQSKFFLGYSSGYEGINERPLTIQNRTGYLKIGYAWVF